MDRVFVPPKVERLNGQRRERGVRPLVSVRVRGSRVFVSARRSQAPAGSDTPTPRHPDTPTPRPPRSNSSLVVRGEISDATSRRSCCASRSTTRATWTRTRTTSTSSTPTTRTPSAPIFAGRRKPPPSRRISRTSLTRTTSARAAPTPSRTSSPTSGPGSSARRCSSSAPRPRGRGSRRRLAPRPRGGTRPCPTTTTYSRSWTPYRRSGSSRDGTRRRSSASGTT